MARGTLLPGHCTFPRRELCHASRSQQLWISLSVEPWTSILVRPLLAEGLSQQEPSGSRRRTGPAIKAREVVGPLRTLVAEDNEDVRALMVRVVERAGHLVDEAADGIEATAALSANQYDLMLLDLSMPRMNGQEVVRWVRAHPERGEGLQIVVITAWGGEARGLLQELGITKVMAKPFRLQDLADVVAEVAAETLFDDRP